MRVHEMGTDYRVTQLRVQLQRAMMAHDNTIIRFGVLYQGFHRHNGSGHAPLVHCNRAKHPLRLRVGSTEQGCHFGRGRLFLSAVLAYRRHDFTPRREHPIRTDADVHTS